MTKRIARITPTKHHRVSVSKPSHYLGFGSSIGTYKPTSDALAGEYVTEDWGRTWFKRISVYVYLDGLSIEEATEALQTKAEGLTNVTLDVDRNDDGYPEVNLVGRRDTTEAEVAEVLRFLDWYQARSAEAGAAHRERLIKQAKDLGLKPEDLA